MLNNVSKNEIKKFKLNDIIQNINRNDLKKEIKTEFTTNNPDKYNKYSVIFNSDYLDKIINDIAAKYLGKLKQSVLLNADNDENPAAHFPSVEEYIRKNYKSAIDYEILYLIFHGRLNHREALLNYNEIENIVNCNKELFTAIAENVIYQVRKNIELSDEMNAFLPSLVNSTIRVCLSVYDESSYQDVLHKYLYAETTSTIALMNYLS